MKIKILGPGCANCRKLYAETEKALTFAGIDADIEKVENMQEIVKYPILRTPALVIEGEVKASGRIPEAPEIVSWIMTAAAKEP